MPCEGKVPVFPMYRVDVLRPCPTSVTRCDRSHPRRTGRQKRGLMLLPGGRCTIVVSPGARFADDIRAPCLSTAPRRRSNLVRRRKDVRAVRRRAERRSVSVCNASRSAISPAHGTESRCEMDVARLSRNKIFCHDPAISRALVAFRVETTRRESLGELFAETSRGEYKGRRFQMPFHHGGATRVLCN